MARSPRRSKYYVRVARPRIETAIVEVEATNDADARRKAISRATELPAKAWVMEKHDRRAYGPHVDTMVTGADFDPPILLDADRAARLLADTETHYLLLMSGGDTDEGTVVLQPWFTVDAPDLLASDLTRDWIASLEQLGLTHLSERLDELRAGSPPTPSDRILFSVPRPPKPRDKQP